MDAHPRAGEVAERFRIVHLEDDPNDALLVRAALDQDGVPCVIETVSTRQAFLDAIAGGDSDLILSDYSLPGFDGLSALGLARRLAPDTPFILVSGTMGEDAAIESLRSGATDYVLKTRLNRLAPAVSRAFEEARERRTRRAAEAALDRERKFLRAVLDSLEAGVIACDSQGTLTLFNRASREMDGALESPVGPEGWAATHGVMKADGRTPLDVRETPLYRALQGEHLRNVEVTIARPGGPPRPLLVSGQPIVDDQGERHGAVITTQDVTELRQLEQQFRQAQKMEAMGRLAAGVAHDFNNLLTVIGGYSQLAQSRLAADHPVTRDLHEIVRAGERAANLTRQLLAFSRQQVLEPRVLDLNVVIGEVDKMLRRLIGADIALEFRPGGPLDPVRADAGQIEQVLVNLVVNARDAMPEGGVITIATGNVAMAAADARVRRAGSAEAEGAGGRLSAAGVPAGEYVALTVADTGTGMDTETLARIFEPFFTTKEAGRGTGLGLSTVHGIVTQSGGHILADSEPGRGTAFRIFLPRAADAVAADRPAAPSRPPERGSETILVVDDDGALRALVREILGLHGYRVVEAADGDEALAVLLARRRTIDALVTDVVMPGVHGRALVERALAERPGLPILYMSGYVGEHVRSVESTLGPSVAYIQKPFSPATLLTRLRSVIDGSAAEAA